MRTSAPTRLTDLLLAWRRGDTAALDRLTSKVHGELRRIARCHLQRERPDHCLQTTAGVHQAYLRLIDVRRVQWRDLAHSSPWPRN